MEYKSIPSVSVDYDNLVGLLRKQIVFNIEGKGKYAKPQTVEDTLNSLMPGDILKGFESWPLQKSELEALFIPYFLKYIVRINMEPERGNNKYQYALATEGRCLQKHKGASNHSEFIRGKPLANRELYTYDELLHDWRNIFVLDEKIDKNENLRDKYAPRCTHGHVETPALVLTTQHQLRIVDGDGNYVPGTNISFCRTKSGTGQLFKMAEYLTNLRADGTERESIDDYLASLSREQDPYKTWVKAMKCVKYVAETTRSKLDNVVRLRGYSQKEVKDLRKALENDPEVGGFVSGRSDLEFFAEKLSKDMEERKFGELWFAVDKNKMVWQVYHDTDFTRIEGDEKTKHIEYKTKREREILEGFTAWHWAIMRRLAPYFLDDYMVDVVMKGKYEPYLNLSSEKFKKPGKK